MRNLVLFFDHLEGLKLALASPHHLEGVETGLMLVKHYWTTMAFHYLVLLDGYMVVFCD